jgi:hypothetical protein
MERLLHEALISLPWLIWNQGKIKMETCEQAPFAGRNRGKSNESPLDPKRNAASTDVARDNMFDRIRRRRNLDAPYERRQRAAELVDGQQGLFFTPLLDA